MNTVPACKNCAFWRRIAKPSREESADYAEYRPCNLGVGDQFVGDRVLGRKALTSPDSTCELFCQRGDVQ